MLYTEGGIIVEKENNGIVCHIVVLCGDGNSVVITEKSQDEQVDLADFKAEDIASITFKNSAEEWTAVNDDGWRVDDSEKTADYAVASIMDTLLNFSDKLIGQGVSDDEYGLLNPSAVVTYVTTNGDSIIFRLRDKTPPGTEYYLADSEDNIYIPYTQMWEIR